MNTSVEIVTVDEYDPSKQEVRVYLTLTVAEKAILNSAMWKAYNITQHESGGCKCDHCKDFYALAMDAYDAVGEAWDTQYDLARGI